MERAATSHKLRRILFRSARKAGTCMIGIFPFILGLIHSPRVSLSNRRSPFPSTACPGPRARTHSPTPSRQSCRLAARRTTRRLSIGVRAQGFPMRQGICQRHRWPAAIPLRQFVPAAGIGAAPKYRSGTLSIAMPCVLRTLFRRVRAGPLRRQLRPEFCHLEPYRFLHVTGVTVVTSRRLFARGFSF
jgi:hypothetical protein